MSGVQQPASLDAVLAVLPSLPRPLLSRLVTRMIQHLDEIDGDADCDEDDAADAFSFSWYASGGRGPGCPVSEPDSGVEDDPRGFDLEDDYCLAHEDFGTMGCITPREKKEVRRVKVACREAQRAKH